MKSEKKLGHGRDLNPGPVVHKTIYIYIIEVRSKCIPLKATNKNKEETSLIVDRQENRFKTMNFVEIFGPPGPSSATLHRKGKSFIAWFLAH